MRTNYQSASLRPLEYRPRKASGFMLIEVSRWMLVMVGAILLVSLITVGFTGFWVGRQLTQATEHPALNAADQPELTGKIYNAKPGPWGELQCQRSVIEVPQDYLGVQGLLKEPALWFFKGYSADQLRQWLGALKLSSSESADLLDATQWSVTAEGIYVHPDIATVLSLSAATRSKLYAELGKFEENVMQNQPFHWPLADEEFLFAGARVSPESIDVFEKLSYRRGQFLLFSDWQALLTELPEGRERLEMTQALMSRSMLFMSLKITPQTDIEALIRYWGVNGNSKDIRPVLEASAQLPQGATISVVNLLPSQVRSRIGTFPFPESGENLNCHWTSFNFFSKNPLPPADTSFWIHRLGTDYERVTGPPRYGDILLLLKPSGALIHSCVFLADDIFYTKNGGSPLAPWVLMALPDLLEMYSWDLPENSALKLVYYRSRS